MIRASLCGRDGCEIHDRIDNASRPRADGIPALRGRMALLRDLDKTIGMHDSKTTAAAYTADRNTLSISFFFATRLHTPSLSRAIYSVGILFSNGAPHSLVLSGAILLTVFSQTGPGNPSCPSFSRAIVLMLIAILFAMGQLQMLSTKLSLSMMMLVDTCMYVHTG